MVTDLNPHLTQRALASLSAELTRREKILAAAGAKDIKEYTERAGREPRRQPLPRLVIVIDEFASLVRDLPEFVTGLVGIAQRGRSLGIHLVLATQRPSGVVSADIRANTNLRIPAQPSPWLPPLPRTLLLRDLPGVGRLPGPGQAPAPFGLIDVPERQQQRPTAISLDSFGHLMAAGAPRSMGSSPLWGMVGVGGDELTALGPDLSEGVPAFIVAGSSRSGPSRFAWPVLDLDSVRGGGDLCRCPAAGAGTGTAAGLDSGCGAASDIRRRTGPEGRFTRQQDQLGHRVSTKPAAVHESFSGRPA